MLFMVMIAVTLSAFYAIGPMLFKDRKDMK